MYGCSRKGFERTGWYFDIYGLGAPDFAHTTASVTSTAARYGASGSFAGRTRTRHLEPRVNGKRSCPGTAAGFTRGALGAWLQACGGTCTAVDHGGNLDLAFGSFARFHERDVDGCLNVFATSPSATAQRTVIQAAKEALEEVGALRASAAGAKGRGEVEPSEITSAASESLRKRVRIEASLL